MKSNAGIYALAWLALLALVGCGTVSHHDGAATGGAGECAIETGDVPVLVHFYAEGVSPAAEMAEVLGGVQEDFGDGLQIVEVDAENCAELAESHGVKVIPTVVLLRDGEQDVQVVGWISREHLDLWLQVHGIAM